jgi:biopolymer transport protein ExbD
MLAALLAAGPPAPSDVRRQSVMLAWDARARLCSARIGSAETGDIETEEGEAALLRALPDKGAAIHLQGTDAVPYSCAQAVVDRLRRAGYTRIGFIAEPAPVASLSK